MRYWAKRALRDLLFVTVAAGIFVLLFILLSLIVHGRVNW